MSENQFNSSHYRNHLQNKDFAQFYGQNVFDPEFVKEVEGMMYHHVDGRIKSIAPSLSILADYMLGVEKGTDLNVNQILRKSSHLFFSCFWVVTCQRNVYTVM